MELSSEQNRRVKELLYCNYSTDLEELQDLHCNIWINECWFEIKISLLVCVLILSQFSANP